MPRVVCIALIASAHVLVGVAFYYGRVARLGFLFQSDFVVFLVPAVGALAAYFRCVQSWTRVHASSGVVVPAILSLVAVALSCVLIATIAFNLWGTGVLKNTSGQETGTLHFLRDGAWFMFAQVVRVG